MGGSLGRKADGRQRYRRALALAAVGAIGTVALLAVGFRLSAARAPALFGSTATFFACVAGLVAVPVFVVTAPHHPGTGSLARRGLVAGVGSFAGAAVVFVTVAAMTGTYEPTSTSLLASAVAGSAVLVLALFVT